MEGMAFYTCMTVVRSARLGFRVTGIFLGSFLLPYQQQNSLPTHAGRNRSPSARVEPTTTVDTVLITGLPALVEYPRTPRSILFDSNPPLCVDFSIRAFERVVPIIRLTSTGMNGARLLDQSRNQANLDCVATQRAKTTIELANVDDTERSVRLVLPAGAFPGTAIGTNGRLILLRPGKPPTEVAVALRREDFGPVLKASFWFVGIALPALLTALLGILVYKYQKFSAATASDEAELARFRKDEAAELKTFFEGLYQTTVGLPDASTYTSTMQRELAAKRILFALPPKARERVLAAVQKGDRRAAGQELAKLFPEHKKTILKSVDREG